MAAGRSVSWGTASSIQSRSTYRPDVVYDAVIVLSGMVDLDASRASRETELFEPDVLPVDRRATDGRNQGWLPRAGALERSTGAIRELVGRGVYRIAGYSR